MKKEITCPFCGIRTDSVMDIQLQGKQPKPGDVSVCARCASIAIFDDELGLRYPTTEEQAVIDSNPKIALFQAGLRRMIEARKKEN